MLETSRQRRTAAVPGGDTSSVNTSATGRTTPRLAVFSTLWALAALFHLAGNPRPSFVNGGLPFTAAALALGIAAVSVLHRPASRLRLALLCSLVVTTAYLEAPVVGNHWVLAAAVSAAFLIACLPTRSRDTRDVAAWRYFAPTARLILLTAYTFAAFAKINSDFFDPSVSCAIYYQNQILSSWGLGALSIGGGSEAGRLIAVGAAMTELSIPILLILRRTRRWGVCLALIFHGFLALDLAQHFWDFTTVLAACFVLFADESQVDYLRASAVRAKQAVRPAARKALAAGGLAAAVTATLAGASAGGTDVAGQGIVVGHAAWLLLGPAAIGAFVYGTWTTRNETPPTGPLLLVPHYALLLLPALVAFNGLTPYLELKTGYGWNMYSNLRTVAGESNHLLVRKTLRLSRLQSDTVTIVATSDPTLRQLIDRRYDLVASEFHEYLAAHPDAAVTFRRDGEIQSIRPGERSSVDAPGIVAVRLQAYRPIDRSTSERCVPAFTAAR